MSVINKTISINLDLKRVTAQPAPIPPLVAGDNGNIIVINLTDDGIPVNLTGCRVLCLFSKTSDGSTVEQDTEDAAIDIDGIGLHDDQTLHIEPHSFDIEKIGNVLTPSSEHITVVDPEAFINRFPDDGIYTFVWQGSILSYRYGEHSVQLTAQNQLTIAVRAASYGAGKNNCELQIYSGESRDILVTTANFNFDGRKAIMNDETILVEEKYPILVNLIQAVNKIRAGMEDIINRWTNVVASAESVAPGGVNVEMTEESGHNRFHFSIPSVIARVTKSGVRSLIHIEDESGVTEAEVVTPIARVTKSGMRSLIHIEDESGVTEAEVVDGTGVPAGGSTHQLLGKRSSADADLEWMTPSASDISASGNQTVQQALDGEASARASADSTLQNNLQELYPAGPYTISAWESNTHSSDTDASFPYRAAITCVGVTSSMRADVVLGVADAMSGAYSPICETGNGVVYIWCNDNTLTPSIQNIIVHKGVAS